MKGSAHGKIILIGEHSVVYGHPAIAIPFYNSYVEGSLHPAQNNTLESSVYTGLLANAPALLTPIKQLVLELQASLQCPSYTIRLKSNLPIGAGLGSSAAIAAAITKAYYARNNHSLTETTLYEWVQFCETLSHENPSGIDALSVISNNGWFFTKKDHSPLLIELHAFLVVGNTEEQTPTKESVAHVANLVKQDTAYRDIIDGLGEMAKKAKKAIEEKDIITLGDTMNAAMEGLKSLGLSTPTIDALNKSAIHQGALASKLTGGGMGGCVIALCQDRKTAEKVSKIWSNDYTIKTWIVDL